MIGVSVDADDHVMREFLNDKKLRFPNYQDAEMKMANDRIGIRVFPSTFIIDADGKLVDIEEAWRYWDEADVINRISGVR